MVSFGGFARSLWRSLDALRKFLHLLVLLALLGIAIAALRTSIPHLPKQAALDVRPEGDLVEQLSGDPIERAIDQARGRGRSQTLLRDVVDAIHQAKTDKRIKALNLQFDEFRGAGQPALEEFARAVQDFRKSGKKVIAYSSSYTQAQYYVAASADEVYVDPLGFVLLDGYERYRMFYKNALDKLGVDMNVFRVGTYKSAVEPFTRNDMSQEDREESLAYLGALWSNYRRAVTAARGLKPGVIDRYITDIAQTVTAAHGDTAQVALDAGLVTGIKTDLDVEDRLIDLVGLDEDNDTYNAVSLDDYVRVVRASEKLHGGPKIGVIVASGEILDGRQPSGTIGGDSTAELIRQARLDDAVKAVVLRVDSPGGSVLASEQIYRELKALRDDGKPLIVSMGDVAASGGYYISAPADEIWASPSTITGSIGIFAAIPNFSRTLAKLGIGIDGVGTTPLSGQLRLDRPLGPEARTLLQAAIEHGYETFLARVSDGRRKTRDQIDAIAQGRVWAGDAAQRIGLVDQLGTFDDAVKAAAARARLGKAYQLEYIEPELSWIQELSLQIQSSFAHLLAISDRHALALAQVAKHLDPLARELERWSRFDSPGHLYAYCFCTID